jgi:prepilin-type N-terminal cleavage/methylation domain-containing protein
MVAPVNSLQAKTSLKEEGFTLVELLVAMLIGAVVLTAVMTSFQSQHNTYLTQDQVVEMQQNARVAMSVLKGDIRSAGYDPSGQGAGIITADSDQLSFLETATAPWKRSDTNLAMVPTAPPPV